MCYVRAGCVSGAILCSYSICIGHLFAIYSKYLKIPRRVEENLVALTWANHTHGVNFTNHPVHLVREELESHGKYSNKPITKALYHANFRKRG